MTPPSTGEALPRCSLAGAEPRDGALRRRVRLRWLTLLVRCVGGLHHHISLSLDVKMLDLISVPRYQDSLCRQSIFSGGQEMWDAGQYLRFGGERARPFFDLVAQVGATSPRYVADLGCGPGNLTAALAGGDGGRRGQLTGDDRGSPGDRTGWHRDPLVRAWRRVGLAPCAPAR